MAASSVLAAESWRQFLIVTKEMKKFLDQDKVDMFLALLEQRLQLQKNITALDDNDYHQTEAGQAVIAAINVLNADIQYKVQIWLNQKRQNQKMARAYDSLGAGFTGYALNRSF